METVNTFKIGGSDWDATIMVNEDGEYFYCVSGMQDGLYSESDDIGGFATQQEAEEDAQSHYFARLNDF